MGAAVSKWSSLAPAHCSDTLQDRRVHTGKPLVEARLRSAGDNQGKLPCSQHHTGSAEQPVGYSPFCCF